MIDSLKKAKLFINGEDKTKSLKNTTMMTKEAPQQRVLLNAGQHNH